MIAALLAGAAVLIWYMAAGRGEAPRSTPTLNPGRATLYFDSYYWSFSSSGPLVVRAHLGNSGGSPVVIQDVKLAQPGTTLVGAYRGEATRAGGEQFVPPPVTLAPGDQVTITLVLQITDCASAGASTGGLELSVALPGAQSTASTPVVVSLAEPGGGNALHLDQPSVC